jgi:hypothetical protein
VCKSTDRISEGRRICASHWAEIKFDGEHWTVPSRSNPAVVYTVDLETELCNCPDSAYRKVACAHVWAATLKAARTFGAQMYRAYRKGVVVGRDEAREHANA